MGINQVLWKDVEKVIARQVCCAPVSGSFRAEKLQSLRAHKACFSGGKSLKQRTNEENTVDSREASARRTLRKTRKDLSLEISCSVTNTAEKASFYLAFLASEAVMSIIVSGTNSC